MTVYGWDCSHFDGALSDADLQRAYAEGIRFFSHKLGEGLSNVDTTAKTAIEAAKRAGIPILGGYWFGHGEDDPVAEADRMIARADADEPWWRDFPYWFWQPDCEPETGHTRPSPTWIQRNADRLHERTGRPVLIYAPHWSYGSSLATVASHYRLWASAYGSNPAGRFDLIYPGDTSSRWDAQPGYPSPLILQYGSRATIAGHTTCDANAYRGTLDQLKAIINPSEDGMDQAMFNSLLKGALKDPDVQAALSVAEWHYPTIQTGGPAPVSAATALVGAKVDTAALASAIAKLLPAGGMTEAQIEQAVAKVLTGGTGAVGGAPAS